MQAIHGLLLLVVTYTDLAHRRVYRWWTLMALVAGLVSAWVSPFPWLHAVMGAVMFGYGYWGWRRELWGGGDVWLLTYLGLTLGVGVAPALAIALALVGVLLLVKRLRWGQSIPLAAFLAAGALVVLCWPAQRLPHFEPLDTASAYTVLLSPLPTATPPDAAAVTCAQEAAQAVAQIGLVPPASRPAQAREAAFALRALAASDPAAAHAALLRDWAAALDAYADGDGALTAITSFSAQNRDYWSVP